MKEIKLNDKVIAIIHKSDDWKKGLDFLTPNETFIQAGTWWYDKGKILNAHKHKINKRPNELTQETIVILKGKLRVDLYDKNDKIFHQEILTSGDIGIMLYEGHGYEILEDNTKVLEVKNGPFVSVEKDKILI